jgi:hypothetical protein
MKFSKYMWYDSKDTEKETLLMFYKVTAVPVLMYGSESWIPKKRELSKIQVSEMRFLRYIKDCRYIDQVTIEDERTNQEFYP